MNAWNRSSIFKLLLSLIFWGAFVLLFLPFYSEILLAGVFALAMEPYLGRHLRGRVLRWRTSIALLLTGLSIVLAIPVTMVGYKAYAYVREVSELGLQNTPMYQKLIVIKSELNKLANQALDKFGLQDRFDLPGFFEEGVGRIANFSLQTFSGFVSQIPAILLSLFVFGAALYFFLAEAVPLKRIMMRQRVLTHAELDRFLKILQSSSYNTVVSSVLIAILQATMVAVGSLILQTGDFAVIWSVTFFCSFVPVIGAGPVALALGAGQLFFGNYSLAIGFLILAIVVGTVDNLIRPYMIAAGADDLHPIVSLLAIIGALILFGMPGLFLGPVIASVSVKIISTLYGAPEPLITASGKDLAQTTT